MARLLLACAALLAQAGRADAQEHPIKSAGPQPVATAVREIDDPPTGTQWLLMRNTIHPEGPGRLAKVVARIRSDSIQVESKGDVPRVMAAEVPPQLVIRGGDLLIVEENTATIEARLEAIALGAAAPGSLLQARLKIGGRIVPVIARSQGRAVLAPATEVAR